MAKKWKILGKTNIDLFLIHEPIITKFKYYLITQRIAIKYINTFEQFLCYKPCNNKNCKKFV